MVAGLMLAVLPDTLAVCRLEPETAVPHWAGNGRFWSVTRTETELSVVCTQDVVPDDIRAERGWAVLRVAGPLDFALTGILAALASPLAAAGIPIFALSTFDTDYLLVKQEKLAAAVTVLRQHGHTIQSQT